MFVFDTFNIPKTLDFGGVLIETREESGSVSYCRSIDEKTVTLLLSSCKQLRVQPIEPLMTPKELTPYLLVEFENSVFIAPGENMEFNLTFPLEVGVLIPKDKGWHLLDCFSLAQKKYSLYGDPSSGLLCQYWKSRWLAKPEDLDALKEGWLHLKIHNTSNRFVEIKKIVIQAHHMKIFYNANHAYLSTSMKVVSKNIVEVECDPVPFLADLNKAHEVFVDTNFLGLGQKFMMEGDL